MSAEDAAELLECARYGEAEDVAALLDAGVPVDTRDAGGSTSLHRAAANGHAAVLALLAARGARLLENASGNTALHWAALNGQAAAVAALLELYADEARVLAKNAQGRSALTEALHGGHEEVARVLLAHKSADVEAAAAGAGGDGAAGDGEETDEEIEEEEDGAAEGGGAGAGAMPPAPHAGAGAPAVAEAGVDAAPTTSA